MTAKKSGIALKAVAGNASHLHLIKYLKNAKKLNEFDERLQPESFVIIEGRWTKCVVCGEEFKLIGGLCRDACGKIECVRKYLAEGKGSVNCAEYKQYMDYCFKVEIEKEGESG